MIIGFFKWIWWLVFGGCLHKWGKWETHRYSEVQYRQCSKCSKIVKRNYY